jgi:hypothetical protein
MVVQVRLLKLGKRAIGSMVPLPRCRLFVAIFILLATSGLWASACSHQKGATGEDEDLGTAQGSPADSALHAESRSAASESILGASPLAGC